MEFLIAQAPSSLSHSDSSSLESELLELDEDESELLSGSIWLSFEAWIIGNNSGLCVASLNRINVDLLFRLEKINYSIY